MKFVTFLICDDIRTEVNNKVSLIGVYDDQILFLPLKGNTLWPRQTQIGAYGKIKIETSDDLEKISNVRISLLFNHTETEVLTAPFPVEIKISRNPIKFNFVVPNFIFSEPGHLKLSIDFLDREGNLISKLSPENTILVKEFQ
jgi:hypothetical protein